MDEIFLTKKADPIPALALHAMSMIENSVDQLICDLPKMDDAALETACIQAQSLGKAAWRVECAICAEVVSRDERRGAKQAFVASIAARVGIGPSTVYRNAQIHNEFKLGEPQEFLGTQTLAEKAFFEEALRAPEPTAALAVIADKKAADPNYTTSDARADVQELKRGVAVEEVETLFWVKVGLKPEEREMLSTLARRWELGMAAALVRILRGVHSEVITQEENENG